MELEVIKVKMTGKRKNGRKRIRNQRKRGE